MEQLDKVIKAIEKQSEGRITASWNESYHEDEGNVVTYSLYLKSSYLKNFMFKLMELKFQNCFLNTPFNLTVFAINPKYNFVRYLCSKTDLEELSSFLELDSSKQVFSEIERRIKDARTAEEIATLAKPIRNLPTITLKVAEATVVTGNGTDDILLLLDAPTPYPNLDYEPLMKISTQKGYGEQYCKEVLRITPKVINTNPK